MASRDFSGEQHIVEDLTAAERPGADRAVDDLTAAEGDLTIPNFPKYVEEPEVDRTRCYRVGRVVGRACVDGVCPGPIRWRSLAGITMFGNYSFPEYVGGTRCQHPDEATDA